MDGAHRRAVRVGSAIAVALALAAVAGGEMADITLRSGMRLRGDIELSDSELILRNAAGEMRLPRSEVVRIETVPALASQPALPPSTAPASSSEAEEAADEAAAAAAREEGQPELVPAPPISKADIQRLRLGELFLDPPAEAVRVQFLKKGRQRDLPVEVLEELRLRADFKPAWEEVLTRGQPAEKLQLIVRETGLKYADRIEILTDTEVFATFRRRVLPLVNKSCARAGCHAGAAARVFRLPAGSKTTDSYAYATFVLLNQMKASPGQMLDREAPEQSLLLKYMLPADGTDTPHPPVKPGAGFKPVLRGRDDPLYGAVVDWIGELARPTPEYGLEYINPYAELPASAGERPATMVTPGVPEGGAAESKPSAP